MAGACGGGARGGLVDAMVAGITVPTVTGTFESTAWAGAPVGGGRLGTVTCGGGACIAAGGTAGGGTVGEGTVGEGIVGEGTVGGGAWGRGGPIMKTRAFVGGLPGGI
jgi:hypothetical protein